MGPKADETTSFHIYVRTADNVEHDLVIYNMSKIIQQLQIRKMPMPLYICDKERHLQLIMAAVHYKKDHRLLDIHVYRNIVVDMYPAISPRRRHMAKYKDTGDEL